jgi:hypothetical protein
MVTAMCSPLSLFAEEERPAKKATTQNVGGLLFDVDEGVKVEQGPGGSVYMKSNREFMQEKFAEIDRKLSDFEKRIAQLESGKVSKESGSVEKEESPQVLVS